MFLKTKIINFLTLCLLVTPLSLIAQNAGTLRYKLSVSTPYGLNDLNFITYCSNKGSVEFAIKKFNTTSTDTLMQNETKGEYRRIIVDNSNKMPFVYKDFFNKKLILSNNISFKLYLINDSLNNFNWEIKKEHQKILNYNCTKATLNFRGRNYIAWFAESIPLPLGPWKFGGLPGLIIKIADSEDKFVYELTGIDLKAKFDVKLLSTPQAYQADKPITHQEFMAIYNAKVEHYKKMSRIVITEANGGYGTNTVTLAEKQEKF